MTARRWSWIAVALAAVTVALLILDAGTVPVLIGAVLCLVVAVAGFVQLWKEVRRGR